MKLLHVLVGGTMGGVEQLCADFGYLENDSTILVLKKYDPLITKLKNTGVKVVTFFDESTLSAFNVSKITNYIFEQYKSGKIESVVIHHPCIFTLLLCIRLKKINSKIPVAFYIHADLNIVLMSDSRKYVVHKLLFKLAAKKVDVIIAISKYVSDTILRMVPNQREKIRVNYNGIILENFLHYDHENGKPLKIVYVGRLVEEKGVQNVLKVLSSANGELFHFDIIGDGPYKSMLDRMVDEYNLRDKVTFLGRIENVPEVLGKYDILIHLPECGEGFGINVVEAMSVGLICIVNNHGALCEIIENMVNGIVLENNELFNAYLSDIYDGKLDYIKENAKISAQNYSIQNTYSNLQQFMTIEND
ncbi:MAG: hypothetical protein K0S41_2709 [Anaerocolumna sp.]|jgi:glycosyltransferase involved in cell wall biosynthesis|nr:hypothetical protein [Anaerocolumna sp.]